MALHPKVHTPHVVPHINKCKCGRSLHQFQSCRLRWFSMLAMGSMFSPASYSIMQPLIILYFLSTCSSSTICSSSQRFSKIFSFSIPLEVCCQLQSKLSGTVGGPQVNPRPLSLSDGIYNEIPRAGMKVPRWKQEVLGGAAWTDTINKEGERQKALIDYELQRKGDEEL